ncbi:MAG: DUF362 domain-containing protein [Candidatus Aminicenantes bacterium]|nr:DUF362 domain-containing protein [Candidatus Aminicenantes bacterium]
MPDKEKVLIRRVPSYNPEVIARVVKEGWEIFGLEGTIGPRITIKPNIVMAHHKVAPSAYTRPEFLDGLLTALGKRKGSSPKVLIAEKTGNGLPTSRMFRRAGLRNPLFRFDLILDAYFFLFLSWLRRLVKGRL